MLCLPAQAASWLPRHVVPVVPDLAEADRPAAVSAVAAAADFNENFCRESCKPSYSVMVVTVSPDATLGSAEFAVTLGPTP